MAAARPKPQAQPRPLESSRDHVLIYDERLRGPNTFRAIRLGDAHLRIEAIVALGSAAHEWVTATARIVDREHESSPDAPAVVRTGAGDGSLWRICPWPRWEARYRIPHPTSFLLAGCPPSWPHTWV